MEIRHAKNADLPVLAELAEKLWPGNGEGELLEAFSGLMENGAAFFLAQEKGVPAGFAQCQLRRDYVEGTSSSPVGYLEGIYVEPSYRNQGLAAALLKACEEWAKGRGCREFASDCELDNARSLGFHLAMNFEEANRIICFTKQL